MKKHARLITLKWLDRHGVCATARMYFIRDWGAKGRPRLDQVIEKCWAVEAGTWAQWVLERVFDTKRLDRWYVSRWQRPPFGERGWRPLREIDRAYVKRYLSKKAKP